MMKESRSKEKLVNWTERDRAEDRVPQGREDIELTLSLQTVLLWRRMLPSKNRPSAEYSLNSEI